MHNLNSKKALGRIQLFGNILNRKLKLIFVEKLLKIQAFGAVNFQSQERQRRVSEHYVFFSYRTILKFVSGI
jgi:hypothetical protein